jgi:hypothetical protein
MADFSFPQLPAVTPPPQTSLGDMMNIARGSQAYQQAAQVNPLVLQQQQQTTRTGQIALSVEEQKDIERRNMQTFFADPNNFQTNGRIDIDKINAQVPKIAPLTGTDYISKYSTLGKAQTDAIDAKQKLTQDQRNMVASRFSVLGRMGVQDKNLYLQEMDLLKKENPDNPDLHRLIDAYKVTWNEIPSGADLPGKAIAGAQTLLTPAQQQTTFAPQVGTLSTGADIKQTTTTPSVGGKAPKIEVGGTLAYSQLPPGSRMVDTGAKDLNNNSIFNVFDANGRAIGQTTVPAGVDPNQLPGAAPVTQLQTTGTPVNVAAPVLANAPVRLPEGPTATQQTKAGTEVAPGMRLPYTVRSASQPYIKEPTEEKDQTAGAEYRNNLVTGQMGLAQSRRNVQEVMDQANKIGSDLYFAKGGIPGQIEQKIRMAIGSEQYDMLAKDLANMAITNSKAMGSVGGTVAGLDMSAVANGTIKVPPDVLTKIARRVQADQTNLDMQANGAQQFAQKFGDNNMKAYQQAWNANADSKIFEAMNITRDVTDPARLKTELNRLFPNPNDYQDFLKKYRNIKKLSETGSL